MIETGDWNAADVVVVQCARRENRREISNDEKKRQH